MSAYHPLDIRCYFCAEEAQLRDSINELNDGVTSEIVDWDSPPELCPLMDEDEFNRLNGDTA